MDRIGVKASKSNRNTSKSSPNPRNQSKFKNIQNSGLQIGGFHGHSGRLEYTVLLDCSIRLARQARRRWFDRGRSFTHFALKQASDNRPEVDAKRPEVDAKRPDVDAILVDLGRCTQRATMGQGSEGFSARTSKGECSQPGTRNSPRNPPRRDYQVTLLNWSRSAGRRELTGRV